MFFDFAAKYYWWRISHDNETKVDQLKNLKTEVTPQKKKEILEKVDPFQPSLNSQYVEEMERDLLFKMKVRFVYFILFKFATWWN